jgi:probable rRNA maturation factor
MPTTRARTRNNVVVQYAVPRRGVPGTSSFRRWARAATGSPVTLRIVGEREGRELNRTFRKRNTATNVLSFDTRDVVLCHPVIRREARAQGKSVAAHYAHLVVHGDAHEKKRDAARMEAREIAILRRVGIGNPYAIESARQA